MKVATLKGNNRSEKGSNQVARLRSAGMVPGVIYGGGADPLSISLDDRDVARELRQHHRVFKIEVGGKTESVYMQDVQYDTLSDLPLHLDFKRIDLSVDLELEVELKFLGHPAGLSKGGRLIKDHNSILVKCKPDSVPEEVVLNIAKLDLGEQLTVGALEMPEGVTCDLPADEVICHVTAAQAAEEEPAEGAEGEAAEGETPAPAEGEPKPDSGEGGDS
ncbi:MAG: 50S ribosomal protein L25 [Planctomycetota bacterium]|jgi:large subunit ribosomal protein L25